MEKIYKSVVKYLIKDMGYMGLPLSWIEADKQKHGLVAYFITTLVFFVLIGRFSFSEATLLKDSLFALAGMSVTLSVGHVKEVLDSKKENNFYDRKDLFTMLYASAGIGLLWILIRQLTFNII